MPSARPGAPDHHRGPAPATAEELFAGHPRTLEVHRAVADAVAALESAPHGDAEPRGVRVRVARSQVSFARRRGFAFVWRPGQYVRSAVPAVLSLALPERVDSPRVKEVAHPSPGVFMHHVEMSGPGDLDDEVLALLRAAYDSAG